MARIWDRNVIKIIDNLLESQIGAAENEQRRQYYERIRRKGAYEEFLRLLPVRERMRILNSAEDVKKQAAFKKGWVDKAEYPIKRVINASIDFNSITTPKFNIIADIKDANHIVGKK